MIYIKSELVLLQMGANNIICWSGAYDNCGGDKKTEGEKKVFFSKVYKKVEMLLTKQFSC